MTEPAFRGRSAGSSERLSVVEEVGELRCDGIKVLVTLPALALVEAPRSEMVHSYPEAHIAVSSKREPLSATGEKVRGKARAPTSQDRGRAS